jgi:predicted MPP superfamily phosphohydrolase
MNARHVTIYPLHFESPVDRLARIVFPHYWEVLSVACAIGEWTLWCWAFGMPASPIVHVAVLAVLFGLNRLAAVGYEHEAAYAPVRHRLGFVTLAGGFACAGGVAGLAVTAIAWLLLARAGGLAAQAGTAVHTPLQWLGPEFRVVGWIGVATAFGLVVEGYLRGYRRLDVTRLDVTLPGLPTALDGFRVVQLSDLHVGPIADRNAFRDALDRAVAEAPDLIVVTGDVVDSPEADLDAWLPELRRLRAPHGVVAILGNHDYEVGTDRVAAALRAATDWTVLRDQIHRVADGLVVVGLEFRRTPREGDALPALTAALPGDAGVLLLAHHPNAFGAARAAGIRLTLAGHTHGGQIAVPFAPHANTARVLMTPYDVGTFVEDGCLLHVNRGIGTSGQRVRIGVPREITVVTLRASAAA